MTPKGGSDHCQSIFEKIVLRLKGSSPSAIQKLMIDLRAKEEKVSLLCISFRHGFPQTPEFTLLNRG
jgi:hypothetical protein